MGALGGSTWPCLDLDKDSNGVWTAADKPKGGRDLGYTRFDVMATALGCHGEYIARWRAGPRLARGVHLSVGGDAQDLV